MADPIAPGQDAEAVSATSPGEGTQNAGFQARISELVAKQHDTERNYQHMLQEERRRNDELLQKLLNSPANAPPQLPDMDPDEARRMQVFMAPMLEQQRQMARQLQEMQMTQTVHQVAAQRGFGADLAQEAAKLAAGWTQGGYSGWKPEDALVYAAGQRALNANAPARNAAGQFVPPAIMGQNAPAPVSQPRATIPANFDDLSPDQQIAALEKLGVGDRPL